MQSEDLHSEINKIIDIIQQQTRRLVFLDYDNPINRPIIDDSFEVFAQCEKKLIEICITNVRDNELNRFVKCGLINEAGIEKTKAYIKKNEDFDLSSKDTESSPEKMPQEMSLTEYNEFFEQFHEEEDKNDIKEKPKAVAKKDDPSHWYKSELDLP
jgi:hypothetical protein